MVVLVVAVSVVNVLAGAAAATVTGGLLAALAVKLFDKIEFDPKEEIRFGAPLVSVPWLYSALVSLLLLYGTRLGVDIVGQVLGPTSPNGACTSAFLIAGIAADWGAFMLGGWLIGRVFPQRALSLAAIAFVVVFLQHWTSADFSSPESFAKVHACVWGGVPDPDSLPDLQQGFQEGVVVGLVVRGVLTLLCARWAARRTLRPASA